MRWRDRREYPDPPQHGDTRIIKMFALLPFYLNRQWCWLETIYVVQKCVRCRSLLSTWTGWRNISWATKEEYLEWKETQ